MPTTHSPHRPAHGRFNTAKTQAHRHERRRVRALLRDIGDLEEPDGAPSTRHSWATLL